MSPEKQREILALSFERSGDGYLYYRWRWSRGVPVTAEEREAYLNIPAMGSRREWRRAIANRPTASTRDSGPVQRKLYAALPLRMAVTGITFGVGLVLAGLAASGVALQVLFFSGGALLLMFAASIIVARLMSRDSAA